jgi:hypothetical protein
MNARCAPAKRRGRRSYARVAVWGSSPLAEEPAAALHTRRQRPPLGRKSGSQHDSASARESGPDRSGSAQATPTRDWGTASGRHLLTVSAKPCDEYCFAYALLRVLCVYWHSCRVSALIPRRKPGLSAYSPAFSWRARAKVARVQASKSDRLILRDTMYWGWVGGSEKVAVCPT